MDRDSLARDVREVGDQLVIKGGHKVSTYYSSISVMRIRDFFPGSEFYSIPDPHQRI
jgi:hypothetical protein